MSDFQIEENSHSVDVEGWKKTWFFFFIYLLFFFPSSFQEERNVLLLSTVSKDQKNACNFNGFYLRVLNIWGFSCQWTFQTALNCS